MSAAGSISNPTKGTVVESAASSAVDATSEAKPTAVAVTRSLRDSNAHPSLTMRSNDRKLPVAGVESVTFMMLFSTKTLKRKWVQRNNFGVGFANRKPM